MHSTPGGRGTPAELLDWSPVQSINDTARILFPPLRNGDPNRRAVHDLIRSGAVAVIDETQPIQRWSISTAELRRYIAEGPRRVAS
jgi:hypothetical protein